MCNVAVPCGAVENHFALLNKEAVNVRKPAFELEETCRANARSRNAASPARSARSAYPPTAWSGSDRIDPGEAHPPGDGAGSAGSRLGRPLDFLSSLPRHRRPSAEPVRRISGNHEHGAQRTSRKVGPSCTGGGDVRPHRGPE